MWDLIVLVPDHCLYFYFVTYDCMQSMDCVLAFLRKYYFVQRAHIWLDIFIFFKFIIFAFLLYFQMYDNVAVFEF